MAASRVSVEAESEIASWFSGRSVFITGGTGFMGKVLIEKLLSSCPGINKIYVLLRRKREISPETRLEQMKQMVIFDKLRRLSPSRLDKLVPIPGDITEPQLGITQADRQTLSASVSVVFHTAATVKFDDPLKESVSMNILATQKILELCKELPKIESFVHVSTAYCNCNREVIEEIVYPAPSSLRKLLAVCESLEDDVLQDITKRIIGDRPNTYTFTKAMGENIVTEYSGLFPIAIFRPSIVSAAVDTPTPGWIDNLNGATGLLAGAGKGVLRSLLVRRQYIADLIPVDLAINGLIAVAWQTGVTRSNSIKVYNCTTGQLNPLTWENIEDFGRKYIIKNPFDDVFWYPGGSFKDNKYLHYVCVYLFQMMPAYLTDYGAWLLGKKTSFSMVRLQKKLRSAIAALEYFTTHQWTFVNKNMAVLQQSLNKRDTELFTFDVTRLNWDSYMEKYVIGVRKYILKEKDSDIEKAKRHMRKLYILNRVTEILFLVILLRAILSRSETARSAANTFINLIFNVFTSIFNTIKS